MNDADRQSLRHAVIEILAARHPAALTVKQVLHRAAMDLDFEITVPDAGAALEFLRGLGHAQCAPDDFGATHYWSATSAGVLAWERSRSGGRSSTTD